MNKSLKKISKKELIELVLLQKERIENLEQEVLEKDKALKERNIKIENSGFLAEALVSLSNIFEEADKVAKEYLDNVEKKCQKIEQEAVKKSKVSKSTKKKVTTKKKTTK